MCILLFYINNCITFFNMEFNMDINLILLYIGHYYTLWIFPNMGFSSIDNNISYISVNFQIFKIKFTVKPCIIEFILKKYFTL